MFQDRHEPKNMTGTVPEFKLVGLNKLKNNTEVHAHWDEAA